MSVQAISWAFDLAPVPVDPSGKPSSTCGYVLAGLANHANPDGSNAFPSVRTLMRYTRLSERTVRTCLDRLEAAGIISPCDPAIIAANIRDPRYRPQGWNLNVTLIRGDLTDDDLTAMERSYPGIRARFEATHGVQLPHPEQSRGATAAPLDNPGSQPASRGATVAPLDAPGVQLTHPRGATDASRGATVAPEPSFEPSVEPSFKRSSRSEPASQSQNGGLEGKSPSRPRERASSNSKRAKAERTKVDRTPEQQAIFDEASKITTAWWEYLKGQGVTVMDSRQFLGCRESIVEKALTRGATPDQVKSALVACGIPFPPAAQFERALVAIQTGRSTAPSGGQPRGRPANVWIDPNATQADRDRSASLWAGVSINGKRVDLQ